MPNNDNKCLLLWDSLVEQHYEEELRADELKPRPQLAQHDGPHLVVCHLSCESLDVRTDIRWATHRWKALVKCGRNEYWQVDTCALGMTSAMADGPLHVAGLRRRVESR